MLPVSTGNLNFQADADRMRSVWGSGRMVYALCCSQANKIWELLHLGESRICWEATSISNTYPVAGWQKPHLQNAHFLLSLWPSSSGSCFRSIWALVKLRFAEFLPTAFLTHHLVCSHVTHVLSKSLLQTSKRIQEWTKSCCSFSQNSSVNILSYFCGLDYILEPGADLFALSHLVSESLSKFKR